MNTRPSLSNHTEAQLLARLSRAARLHDQALIGSDSPDNRRQVRLRRLEMRLIRSELRSRR